MGSPVIRNIKFLNLVKRNSLNEVFTNNLFDVKTVTEELKKILLQKDQQKLMNLCKSLPKLRTFNQISDFSSEKCYLSKPLSFVQRKALAKLRLGVLQIRIETGRYERPKKTAFERICKQCDQNLPEDEKHFLLHCPKHSIIRRTFFGKITLDGFSTQNDTEQLKYLVNSPDIVKATAQFIIDCFDNRVLD